MIEHFNALPNNYALLGGRYQILEVLGSGGFGITYLCFDNYLEKKVAIKEYMPCDFAVRQQGTSVQPKTSGEDRNNFDWGLKAFLQEARTLARFHHPQIIQVENFFEENHTAYLVMEYAQGQTLDAYLKTHHHIGENELKNLLLALIDGLAQVHEAGIFHRDIKPGNIIIRDDGSPVLIDFGAARQNIGSKSRPITTLITPGYAPMEQYDSSAQLLGPWTDIYALGALAFHCLTGSQPTDSPNRVMQRDPNADPVALQLQQLEGKVSGGFLTALSSALAIYAEQRPQTLQQWRKQLSSAPQAENRPVPAPPPVENAAQPTLIDDASSPLLSSINRSHSQRPEKTAAIHDRAAKTELAAPPPPSMQEEEPPEPVANETPKHPDSEASAIYKKYLHLSCGWLFSIPLLSFLIAGIFDEYIGITLVFAISVLSACTLLFFRYKHLQKLFIGKDEILRARLQYLGCERAVYWFGFSFVSTLLLALIFDGFGISLFGLNDDNTGGCIGILLSTGVAAFILLRYRTQLLGAEIAVYWLGLTLCLLMLLGIFFDESYSDWFGIGTFASGFLLALLLSTCSGLFILFKRRANLHGTEIALYWLGLNVNLLWMLLLFLIDNAGTATFVITFMLPVFNAAIILFLRRKHLAGAELTIYWAGLSFDALLLVLLTESLFVLFLSLLASIFSGGFLFWKYRKSSTEAAVSN